MVRRYWVNFRCRGVLLILIIVGQGPIVLAVGAGGGCLDIFSLICHFSILSPSLWETARYRLKYYLKGPLNPKQPTNQPTKNTAYIFLTFRNHVKIFLSQNILQDILNVVYRTTLSIRTERTDKHWRHWSDCSLWSSLTRVFTVCHSICFIYTTILQGKPKLFSLRIFSILFQVFKFLEVSIWKNVCW